MNWLDWDRIKAHPDKVLLEAVNVFSRFSRYSEIYGDIILREHHFLNSSKLRQLAAAESFKDAVKLLEDTRYSYLSRVSSMDEAEELMRKDLIDEVLNAPLDRFGKARMSYVFRYWDYENLKIALKSHVMGLNPELGLSIYGTQLFKLVAENGLEPLKGIRLYKPAKLALHKYNKSKDPLDIDLYLDKFYFANHPLQLDSLFKVWIDIENTKAYYRVRGDERLFKRAYIPRGNLRYKDYLEGLHERAFEKELGYKGSLREWVLDLRFVDEVYEDGLYNPLSFEFTLSYFVRRLYEVKMLDFLLSTRGYYVKGVLDYVHEYEKVMRLR